MEYLYGVGAQGGCVVVGDEVFLFELGYYFVYVCCDEFYVWEVGLVFYEIVGAFFGFH